MWPKCCNSNPLLATYTHRPDLAGLHTRMKWGASSTASETTVEFAFSQRNYEWLPRTRVRNDCRICARSGIMIGTYLNDCRFLWCSGVHPAAGRHRQRQKQQKYWNSLRFIDIVEIMKLCICENACKTCVILTFPAIRSIACSGYLASWFAASKKCWNSLRFIVCFRYVDRSPAPKVSIFLRFYWYFRNREIVHVWKCYKNIRNIDIS